MSQILRGDLDKLCRRKWSRPTTTPEALAELKRVEDKAKVLTDDIEKLLIGTVI
jgi:hypothetical protein